MKNIIYSIFFCLLLCSCTNETKKETVKDRIQGSWVDINAEKVRNDHNLGPFQVPIGFNFQNDRVDFFRQFAKYERDSVTNKMHFNAYAGFIPYQLKADSLFILNPLKNNLEFRYTIDTSKKDTLLLKNKDDFNYMLERLPKQEKNIPAFDQVVFSRSGCFGSCPVMNISIHSNGSVFFYGERDTDAIGLYKAKLSSQFTHYLFQKFNDVTISKVDDYYNVGHTDDETVSTTFIQNGTIIKTVRDYGKAGTKELLWMYATIESLYKQLALTEVVIDKKNPELNQYSFEESTTYLYIEKSESFLLWKAFQNSQITTSSFEKRYVFDTSYYRNEFIKAESDGQFYKFYLKNGETITYDIGYNFITRNFTESDFKITEIID